MMKKTLAILTALVMLFTLAASALAEPAAAAAQLTLEDIKALNGGEVTVYEESGEITFLGGTCTADPVKNQEDAEKVIESVMGLIGGNEKTQFEPWRVLTDPAGNIYYVFQQVIQDMLAQGGAVKIITDRDGNMTGLTATVIPVPEEKETAENAANLTAEQAEALVLQHEKEAGNGVPDVIEGQTVKIVLPVDRVLDVEAEIIESRYVWAVYTTNTKASVSGTDLPYLAHYVTLGGEYLYSLPTIIPGDTAGAAGFDASYVFEFMEPADYTGYVDYSDGSEHEITVTLMRDTRTGMYYLGNIERRIIVADCWEFLYNGGKVVLEYSPDNREWDQTSLISLYNYCRAYDYYKAIGWNGADGEGTPIVILKGFCDSEHNPVNNAAFAGKFYGCQVFLSSSINDYAQCLDVLAHEFTHCVTHSVMTYNAYMNDYGAINEAISDIQGNLCEMLAGATADTEWTLGENGQNPVRSMSDPHKFTQPEYVWDVYYCENVKDPTDANDHGGVHTNSSLLNRVAYLLCTEGGMTLEEARTYWFAADCSMVPGSDYPQLKALLPWVMKNMGMEKYQDVLAKAIEATRLGETAVPEHIEENKALLTMELPDTEIFNNGKWVLQVTSLNLDNLGAFLDQMTADVESGNLAEYPQIIRNLLGPAPTPDPAAEQEKPGFLDFLGAMIESLTAEKTEPEPEPVKEESPESKEMKAWLQAKLPEIVYSDMGRAGQDGHVIRMMSKPGLTLPLLIYLSADPGGAKIEQMKYVLYINGKWIDPSPLMDAIQTQNQSEEKDFMGALRVLAQSELFTELMKAVAGSKNLENFLKTVTLNVKGGQIFAIPTEGLDKIDLEGGIKDQPIGGDEVPNDRKSRPKETAAAENDLAAHITAIKEGKASYTISTTEFGPLEPGNVDPADYCDLLLDMTFEEADLSSQPDGEYVVLHFPEENLYYYFFLAEEGTNYILRTDGADQNELFLAVPPADRAAASGVMSAWYMTLADSQGLIDWDKAWQMPEGSEMFNSEWNCEDAWADVLFESDGFKAVIRKTTEYPKGLEWEYTLEFNPETKSLESVAGIKHAILYQETGEPEITGVIYEDGAATLTIDENGMLHWEDKKEDEGKGLAFYNIGRFTGKTWMDDRAVLEVFLEDVYVLKAMITWGSSVSERTEWVYAGVYDPGTNTLRASHVICDNVTFNDKGEETERKNVYEKDCEADLSMTDEGNIVLTSTGDDQLEGKTFTLVPQQ